MQFIKGLVQNTDINIVNYHSQNSIKKSYNKIKFSKFSKLIPK